MRWLLYLKLVLVSTLLGGFVCVGVLVLTASLDDLEDWRRMLDTVSPLFLWVLVPGSFVLAVVSVLLLWPRRKTLLRKRWMQAKLVLLVLTLPALHLAARWAFGAMRREVEDGSPEGPTGLLGFFFDLVVVTTVVLLVALWLARFRPRLGQGPPSTSRAD